MLVHLLLGDRVTTGKLEEETDPIKINLYLHTILSACDLCENDFLMAIMDPKHVRKTDYFQFRYKSDTGSLR